MTDQEVTAGGVFNDFEVLRGRRSDHNYLGNIGVSAERVSGANGYVPSYEDTDPHEGSTGVQTFSGRGSSERRTTAISAAIAAASSRGEKRFTAPIVRSMR